PAVRFVPKRATLRSGDSQQVSDRRHQWRPRTAPSAAGPESAGCGTYAAAPPAGKGRGRLPTRGALRDGRSHPVPARLARGTTPAPADGTRARRTGSAAAPPRPRWARFAPPRCRRRTARWDRPRHGLAVVAWRRPAATRAGEILERCVALD